MPREKSTGPAKLILTFVSKEKTQALTGGRKLHWLMVCGLLILVFSALLLWGTSLPNIDPHNITDIGLVTALPPTFFFSLGLLTISFCLALHQRRASASILFLHIIVLIVILHGTLALVYDAPRYAWTYRHLGVTDYIQRNGSIDPYIDASHNWPGFFAITAFFNAIAGIESAMSYAAWAQVFFNLLNLGAILFILKNVTSDRRLIWLSIWFFYLANWVGQDYLSPQALNYFFYLIFLGISLKWFAVKARPSELAIRRRPFLAPLASIYHKIISHPVLDDSPETISKPGLLLGLKAILILIFAVIVSGHQLTPLMAIVSIVALVVFQRSHTRSLPVLMIVLMMTWLIYMAVVFLEGRTVWYKYIFQLFSSLYDSLFLRYRLQGESGHTFVLIASYGLTGTVWGLALLGFIRRLRKHYWDLSIALLIVAPFSILFLLSYGGEMLVRVHLFILPWIAFFAAALLYPSPSSGASWRTTVITMLVSGALLTGLSFAYYGNERMNHFTQDEVNATRYIYNTAPPGSLVLSGSFNYPNRFQGDYNQYSYISLAKKGQFIDENFNESDVEAIVSLMGENKYAASYLLFTRSQQEYTNLYNLLPEGALNNLIRMLLNSNRFRVIFANPDATIFVLAEDDDGAGQ